MSVEFSMVFHLLLMISQSAVLTRGYLAVAFYQIYAMNNEIKTFFFFILESPLFISTSLVDQSVLIKLEVCTARLE